MFVKFIILFTSIYIFCDIHGMIIILYHYLKKTLCVVRWVVKTTLTTLSVNHIWSRLLQFYSLNYISPTKQNQIQLDCDPVEIKACHLIKSNLISLFAANFYKVVICMTNVPLYFRYKYYRNVANVLTFSCEQVCCQITTDMLPCQSYRK